MDAISGSADRTVTLPGGRLPEGLVSVLFNSPDLIAVSPLMSAYVRVEGSDEPLLLFGVDPRTLLALEDMEIRAVRFA